MTVGQEDSMLVLKSVLAGLTLVEMKRRGRAVILQLLAVLKGNFFMEKLG